MQQELKDKVRFLVGDAEILEQMRETAGFEPFAPETVEFLDEFSKLLRGDADAGKYSDVQTFAFWCRKSSVLRMKENYGGSLKNRTGRGLAFHVAPSNIPMMFLFSMAVALLAGNSSIVRVSSREFEQSTAACRLLQKLLGDHPEEAGKIVILRYPHEEELTRYFSAVCDSRIIWGGRSVDRRDPETAAPAAWNRSSVLRPVLILRDQQRGISEIRKKAASCGKFL